MGVIGIFAVGEQLVACPPTLDELLARALLDQADDRAPALRIDPDRESLVLDRGAIHGVPPGISPGSGYRDGPIGSVAKRRDVTRDEGKPQIPKPSGG